jgi:CHASE2 domain-containing sensor protein
VKLLSKSTIVIYLLLFVAVLLVASIGAFLLYVPFLPVTIVAVILLGMVLTFLIGARVGGTQVLRLHLIEQRIRRLRLRRSTTSDDIKEPLALAAPSDE